MNKKVSKPWGWYKVLSEGSDYVTKELMIYPTKRFSLQTHSQREEHWHVLAGSGILTLGDTQKIVYPNDNVFIPIGEKHRLEAGSNGILIFEIQRGVCREDDIYRFEDDFDRA